MTGCLANSKHVGASVSVPFAMLKGWGSRFPPEAMVPAEGLVSGTKVENPPSKGCDRCTDFLPRQVLYTFN